MHKKFSLFNLQFSTSPGFTLLELIVVFSIIAILSSIGIASFVTYANSQKLRTATLDVKTMLQQARSQALSQEKPTSCVGAGNFQGYEVRLCCFNSGGVANNGSCPVCENLANDNYELDAICGSSAILISGAKLPTGVGISSDSQQTTQRTFHFTPITGGIANLTGNTATITLNGANNSSQTITVTSTGVIQ